MDSLNPQVKRLAEIIGRTADAVAYRLVNYASCDPILQQRGVSGMGNGKKKCLPYWNKYINDRERLINVFRNKRKKAWLHRGARP